MTGTLEWGNNTGKCNSTNAGWGTVWNDTGDVGLPAPGDATKLVGLTGKSATGVPGGDTDGNRVHMVGAGCSVSDTHTYVASLPSQVCIIGYHVSPGQTSKPFHSIWEADGPGGPGNTDNSIEEPTKGGQQLVCAQIVKPLSDVELHETGSPSTVNPNDSITYTVKVDNLSTAQSSTTQTQHLDVKVDANQTITAATTGNWTNCTRTTSELKCDWTGILKPGDKADDVTVTATVLANGESSVGSTAHVDNGDNSDDANLNNQDDSVTTPVNAPQNILIDKTATPQVQVGDTIEYTMQVNNNSSSATTGTISVTDLIPTKVTYLDTTGTGSQWNCNNAQNLLCTWTGPALTAKGSAGDHTSKIVVHARAEQAAVPSVDNTAHAHEGSIDVQDTATTIVNTPVNLILTKSADPASGSDVSRGQTIDYTLHYANTGSLPANGVTISDTIPAGTTYADSAGCTTTCTPNFDGSQVTFSLNLPANASGDAHFSVTVNNDDVDGQVITNQANLSYNGSVIFSNKTHHQVLVPTGDLTITKAVTYTKPATVGSLLTYSLTAAATGSIDQTNVVVTDAIPDGTTLKSGSLTCSTSCPGALNGTNSNGTVFWNVGTMHPGDVVTMTFAVTVNGADAAGTIPTEIVNVGDIQSNQTPKTPSNRVIVPLTTVLGTKIVKVPTTTTLPFTGLNSLQDALLAAVLIGGGMLLLTWPRLQRRQSGTV